MTTTPATTKPAARKAAPKTSARKRSGAKLAIVETPAAAAKPARKRAATAESPATGELIVEAHPLVGASITIEQVDQLATAHELANATTAAFETLVCELLRAGASPSHIGQVGGLGNSSIRRIGWRYGIGTPPPARQR
jgi:hypothetical protein